MKTASSNFTKLLFFFTLLCLNSPSVLIADDNNRIPIPKAASIQYACSMLLSEEDTFYGFNNRNLWDKWQKNGNGYQERGPQNNIFDKDLVSHLSQEGEIKLSAHVTNTKRYASEIECKKYKSNNLFPTTGTFSARIMVTGSDVPGWESIKTFFTYSTEAGNNPCAHMEHDFEILSEKEHRWMDISNDTVPTLSNVTHQKEEGCSNLEESEYLKQPKVIHTDIKANKYYTLILSNEKTFSNVKSNNQYYNFYTSRYYLVDDNEKITYIGKFNTKHRIEVTGLKVMFNLWWLKPDPNNMPASDDRESTYEYIDWFMYSPDVVKNTFTALNTHNKGQRKNNGCTSSNLNKCYSERSCSGVGGNWNNSECSKNSGSLSVVIDFENSTVGSMPNGWVNGPWYDRGTIYTTNTIASSGNNSVRVEGLRNNCKGIFKPGSLFQGDQKVSFDVYLPSEVPSASSPTYFMYAGLIISFYKESNGTYWARLGHDTAEVLTNLAADTWLTITLDIDWDGSRVTLKNNSQSAGPYYFTKNTAGGWNSDISLYGNNGTDINTGYYDNIEISQ